MADSTGTGARPPGWRGLLSARVILVALAAGAGPSARADMAVAAGTAPDARTALDACTCRATWSSRRLGPFGQDAFRLADGGLVRLVDLRLPGPGPAEARVLAVLAGFSGEEAQVGAVGEPDRWERVPAILQSGRERPVDLAELLVGEGLALVDAGARDALCRPALLATEAAARLARRGLWASDDAVLRAQDTVALAAAAGRFVVVTGRIVSVGVRRDRTYLNFGRDWARDFAVTIPRRSWSTLAARGHTAESLRGATVRVRGYVEMRRAPGLDLVAADMLEVVSPRRAPNAATRGDHDRHDDP